MAEIKVSSAFVEDVVSDREGNVFALRTSEPHRRKNEQGEWETTARTFRTVKVSRDSGVSLSEYRKGDRVEFTGNEKTERRDKDGKTYYDLVVWASSVAAVSGQSGRQQQPEPAPDQWATPEPAWGGGSYGDDTPF
ncbi:MULTISPECIES: single-stranded DNA-binding protein [unclassified Microbacterium]|uniref:single-stranded DNA-binding protein n=1 Tax=unclassified Microbacterium TaxID=2609290 RepID=UPI00386B82CE